MCIRHYSKFMSTTALCILLCVILYAVYRKMSHSSPTISTVTEPIELPKSLYWDAKIQALYFIDIYQSNVHKYVPHSNIFTTAHVGDKPLSFIIPLKDNDKKFVISYGRDIATIEWDGVSTEVQNLSIITNVDPRPQNRINIGKVSPSGVLFVGSTGGQLPSGEAETNVAGLYAYKDKQVKTLLTGVSIANGMAWTEDEKKFYFIDSLKYQVYSYDYDKQNCELSNEKVIYDFRKGDIIGLPDGLTIDAENKLWITSFGGHTITRIDPDTGTILQSIHLLSLLVTSSAFGGPALDELYITTGFYKLSDEERKKFPDSGRLTKITNLGIKGRPEDRLLVI